MERQSGLIGGGLLNDGFSRGHCFFHYPTSVQHRQTLQGTVFLSEESLGSSLKCVRGGLLGPWNYCNFRAVSRLFEFQLVPRFFQNAQLGLLMQQESGFRAQLVSLY